MKPFEDYYAGRMPMPGRSYKQSTTNTYRFGFNGQEKDSDVKGEGNQQDYGSRIYDGRLGRFLALDPLVKSFVSYSAYQFAGNTLALARVKPFRRLL